MVKKNNYTFEISLSVLNHLGRNLYRNFVTVLGEAISNSWDADAENVWIYIDRDDSSFVIKDDGDGMNKDDFQKKFLKVGYSKRKGGEMCSKGNRPYIGAKGIGKLALLSCAEKVSILSKTSSTEYTGGVIDNTGLDDAIEHELTPDKYPLDSVDLETFNSYTDGYEKGTIIHFDQTKDSIRNTIPYLKKLIALHFRFSLIDENFNIFVNDEKVTFDDIKDLADSTEFLWNLNELEDEYVSSFLSQLKEEIAISFPEMTVKGFIASVNKPRFLKITGTEEKAGIDLFVNGRLRERNILRHLPDFSTRYVASYLYGQIHFNELDNDISDKVFTSSREGIVSDNDEYNKLLKLLKEQILEQISSKWDEWRLKHDEIGDEDNPQKSKKSRYARSLYKESAADYSNTDSDFIKEWIKELREEAEFNVPAYTDCFLSENLVRKYINEKPIPVTPPAQTEIDEWKPREQQRKSEANISFSIRQGNDDLSYLGMDFLTKIVEGTGQQQNAASLVRDAIEYKPMRNVVGHTGLLTQEAKTKLNLVYQNIKGRLSTLFSENNKQ